VPSLLPTISWALPIPVLATDIATLRANKLQKSKWIKTHGSECTKCDPVERMEEQNRDKLFWFTLGGILKIFICDIKMYD